MSDKTYTQCLLTLQEGGTMRVCWIETSHAKVGNCVSIDEEDDDRTWVVSETWSSKDGAQAREDAHEHTVMQKTLESKIDKKKRKKVER